MADTRIHIYCQTNPTGCGMTAINPDDALAVPVPANEQHPDTHPSMLEYELLWTCPSCDHTGVTRVTSKTGRAVHDAQARTAEQRNQP